MAGLGIRRFTDEMINPRLAWRLSRQGYDVLSCQRAGRANQHILDEPRLEYATQQGRAILTYNAGHFIRLDREWKASGRRHAGIIVSPQIIDVAELSRRVKLHLDTVDPGDQADAVFDLPT